MKKKFTRLCAVILPATWINSCSIVKDFEDEGVVAKQRELFSQLCNAKERSIVYRTTEASGYLSASSGVNNCLTGWDPIFQYGYHYAECTTARLTSHVLPDAAEIYRFTLKPEGHPDCGTGEKRLVDYSRRTYRGDSQTYKETNYISNYKKQHEDKLEGRCLVVNKVREPMSRYMELHEYVYIDEGKQYYQDDIDKKYGGNHSAVRRKKGMITAGRTSIIHMDTGQYLSQYNYYSFFPKSMVYVTAHTVQCENDVALIKPNTVLIPGKTQN